MRINHKLHKRPCDTCAHAMADGYLLICNHNESVPAVVEYYATGMCGRYESMEQNMPPK